MSANSYSPEEIILLGNLRFQAKTIVEGLMLGSHSSPYHGFSVEFSQHRPYMPGDDIRHVDWQVYGKTDRYYIRQFEEETNLNTYILVDNSRSMDFKGMAALSKYQYARMAAGALIWLLIHQNDAAGLAIFNESIDVLYPPRSVMSYLNELLAVLQNTPCSGATYIGDALHRVTEKLNRKGLVILISDFLDNEETILKGLDHIRYLGHDVLAVQLLDPAEWNLDMPQKYRFKDMENDEDIKLDVRQVRAEYRRKIMDFTDMLNRRCGENGIDHSLILTDMDCRVALLEFLKKRRRLY
ncbi:MAG: DUF58 domain-containing protein [Candidatus Neomarinimicrobiota bacterium]|jgi:uncharacterized protein (DUF58 family)|nr:DUF58 domain-containing protein [Candidatus Neomarinimicrobiota bacterium]MDD3966480.1 DUF58 domain-containing protein [Candidatus Neomarinimicrobiota bacterium]MDX9781269.1 DUF58 domain-containing protein [bacterium]